MPIVPFPLNRQRLEHALLVRVRSDVKVRERDGGGLTEGSPVVLAQRLHELVAVDLGVVGLEVLGCPVALEGHPHSVDHVRGIHRRQPHVPFEAVEERRVREV